MTNNGQSKFNQLHNACINQSLHFILTLRKALPILKVLFHCIRCGIFGKFPFPLTSGTVSVPKVLVTKVSNELGYIFGTLEWHLQMLQLLIDYTNILCVKCDTAILRKVVPKPTIKVKKKCNNNGCVNKWRDPSCNCNLVGRTGPTRSGLHDKKIKYFMI